MFRAFYGGIGRTVTRKSEGAIAVPSPGGEKIRMRASVKQITSVSQPTMERGRCRKSQSLSSVGSNFVRLRSLLNKVIASDKPAHRIISHFSNTISDGEVLGSRADDLIQEGFRKMLERGEVHEFEWMKRILQTCPQVLKQCPKDILHDFLERVKRHDKNALSDDNRKILNEIQNILENL